MSDLAAYLLEAEDAIGLSAHGDKQSAVLIPVSGWPTRPEITFTERRADLRRHAGEISFPGGRPDHADEHLTRTALREAHEEIGLPPGEVRLAGALPPTGTFVTGYSIYPFVGEIPAELVLEPNPDEVATVLRYAVADLRDAFEMRRLVRRGILFRTPTYEMDRHLIWGATARILQDLLERLP